MNKDWLVEVSIGLDFNSLGNTYFYIPMGNYNSAKEAVDGLDSILKGYRGYSFIEDRSGRSINVSKIANFKITGAVPLTDTNSKEM